MDVGKWCHHDHTVVIRLNEQEAFTVESNFHTSDYLVTEVRVRQHANQPNSRNVNLQGLLLSKKGTPTQRVITRSNCDYTILPDEIIRKIEAELETAFGCEE